MKKSMTILFGVSVAVVVFVGLFFLFISYSSTDDVSQEADFKDYLNKAVVVKQASALRLNPDSSNRFSAYYIDVASEEAFVNDSSILKKYKIGDTIRFTSAKRYFSYHVGESYYLLGNETLDSGEIIEFEYGVSFAYSPAIWESLEEFLERRE